MKRRLTLHGAVVQAQVLSLCQMFLSLAQVISDQQRPCTLLKHAVLFDITSKLLAAQRLYSSRGASQLCAAPDFCCWSHSCHALASNDPFFMDGSCHAMCKGRQRNLLPSTSIFLVWMPAVSRGSTFH